jgi:hypothetical protein
MGHHITTVGMLSAAILALLIGDGQGMAAPWKAGSARPAPAGSAPAKPSPAPAATIDDLLDLVAANPVPAPASSPSTTPAPPPVTEAADASAIPPGAPDDDYGLVAWCEGALTGHMALFPVVKPELDRMEQTGDKAKDAEMDAEQMAAGREYLELYARARQAADARGDGAPPRAAGLIRAGETLWAPVLAADPNARMWSWVMWELPARCETAARRLVDGTSVSSDVLRRHSSDDATPAASSAIPTDSPVRR